MLLFAACGGGGTVVHTAFSEPADYSITSDKGEDFRFKITDEGKYSLQLEITYFSEQMQGNETMRMRYTLDGGGTKKEDKFSIPLKTDKGWAGEIVKEGGMDYIVKHNVAEGLSLKPGDYSFHLYADTDAEHPILGMVKIQFNLLN